MTKSIKRLTWHLLTGEYPPAPGGVSDYTRLVAKGLAAAGDAVEIWAPKYEGTSPEDHGVHVNWLPSNYGWDSLRELERILQRSATPRRLIIQYVPHAFGFKGMNIALVRWLMQAKRKERIWAVFHEVCFPRFRGQPLKHTFLATVQRWMARQVALAAQRRFVTTPQWSTLLHSFGHLAGQTEWLPVPSNVATMAEHEQSREIRARMIQCDGYVLGHFGTFGSSIASLLTPILLAVLNYDTRRVFLLLGRGAVEYVDRISSENPGVLSRLFAKENLNSQDLANHLAACDLLLQPYPDGATARRGSLMAGVALGLPIVTSTSLQTELLWDYYKAVCLVENAVSAWCEAINRLLSNYVIRSEYGQHAKLLYESRFSVECIVKTLKDRDQEDNKSKI